MKIRNLLDIDFLLFFSVIILTFFGILFIYSSGITSAGVQVSSEYIRQIVWGVTGIIIMIIISMFDYRRLYDFSLYLYLGTLGLLLYTVFLGRPVNGARAWIGIGSFGIQPSEFAKITTVLFLARYLDNTKHGHNGFRRFIVSCIIVFIPMLIILAQPDFGTALVFIPILLTMTFIAGIATRYVIFLISCIALTFILMVMPLWQTFMLGNSIPSLMVLTNFRFIGIVILSFSIILLIALFGYRKFNHRYFYWIAFASAIVIFSLGASFLANKVLKDYQIMRLIVFLDPYIDSRGAGWNIIQSITAIGSGGLLGKGYLQGTQSHYRFLPEQSTDFIFSIFSEEWGFTGGILVFTLFIIISLRVARIMKATSDPFGSYFCAGIIGMFVFHFLINVGMVMGIMPITGIPLLFMSYGGSALLSAMTAIGLCLSIYVRRFQH